jgi:protein TonB
LLASSIPASDPPPDPEPEPDPEPLPLLEPDPLLDAEASFPEPLPELDPLLELPSVSSPSWPEFEEPQAATRAAVETKSARFRERARMATPFFG